MEKQQREQAAEELGGQGAHTNAYCAPSNYEGPQQLASREHHQKESSASSDDVEDTLISLSGGEGEESDDNAATMGETKEGAGTGGPGSEGAVVARVKGSSHGRSRGRGGKPVGGKATRGKAAGSRQSGISRKRRMGVIEQEHVTKQIAPKRRR